MPYRGFGVRSQRYPVSPAYPAEPSEDPQHSHEIPVSGSSLAPLTSSRRITSFPFDFAQRITGTRNDYSRRVGCGCVGQ